MILEGIYRRFQGLRVAKGPIDARFTFTESLAVEQVGPAGLEMTRAGRRFYLGFTAAPTGIAPVQAWPTTAAQWVLWNADANKTHFYKALGAYPISGTPGAGGQLLAAIITAPAQSGLATSVLPFSASNGSLTSKMSVKSGVTITAPAAPAWAPIAENLSPNVGAFPGSGLLVNRALDGRFAVQPGQGLALAVLALAGTTPLFVPLAEWIEQETDTE